MRRGETTDSDEDDLAARFARVIAVLARGELTFPAPFDLATSSALASNIDRGDLAERLFEVTASRQTGYRVAIYATAPGVPDRAVIDTAVPSTQVLIALLDGFLEEQEAKLT